MKQEHPSTVWVLRRLKRCLTWIPTWGVQVICLFLLFMLELLINLCFFVSDAWIEWMPDMCVMQFNDDEWDKHKIWNQRNTYLYIVSAQNSLITHYQLLIRQIWTFLSLITKSASANSLKVKIIILHKNAILLKKKKVIKKSITK